MPRRQKTRSAVANFIKNVKSELGTLEDTQEQPLLYPPQKTVLKYPELTFEQTELVNISRQFLVRALNSAYYQLFKRPKHSHILQDDSDHYASEFSKSLIEQRPWAFPKQLSSKKQPKHKEDTDYIEIGLEGSDAQYSEEMDETERPNEEIDEEKVELKGIWEDDQESESPDSEEMI